MSDEKLTELGERFKQINDIDNMNDLIDLIMRQSKERNTVTTKKMRKALAEQNIEICKDIANKQIFGILADTVHRTAAEKIIHAPRTGDVVKVDDMPTSKIVGYGRFE